MRQQRRCKKIPNVSLLPFLAVLICTMGVLVVLLVIVVQQARVEANVVSDEQLDVQTEKHQWAVEDAEWRLEMLSESRREMQDQLEEERLRLAGIEDHIRQLKQELKALREQAYLLKKPLDLTQAERALLERQLSQLRKEIKHRQGQLASLQSQVAQHERSYSILAYEGDHGTRRRPIFIECLPDRVVLQPEEIVLTAEDFAGPQGPGNPLASSLRAIREYLNQYDPDASQGEPYPLLIIRPHAAEAYSSARRAMKTWDAEFGYELLDAETILQFPPPDPALAQRLQRTIDEARRRRVLLANASPSRFGGGHLSSGLVLSPHGGFVKQDRGTGQGLGGGWRQKPGLAFGNADESDQESNAHPIDNSGEQLELSENSVKGERNDQQANGQHGNKMIGDNASPGSPGHRAAGQNGNTISNSTGTSSRSKSRGKDWGLPGKTPDAIGFSRPISVTCYSDRLVIHAERGDVRPPQIVRIQETTHQVVEEFISQVWTHMEAWGIAGRQSYWKPVLEVAVEPGGEPRFLELQELLDSSGIDVQRKRKNR